MYFVVDKKPISYPGEGEYEGNVDSNGKRQGWGKMTYTNRTSDDSVATYVGEWSNDKWHGRGIRTKVNGRRYEGEFKDGTMNGRGVNTWPNGERYEVPHTYIHIVSY
jgi:hypothetical protein